MTTTQMSSSLDSLPRDLHQLAARAATLAADGTQVSLVVTISPTSALTTASWRNGVALPAELPNAIEVALDQERRRADLAEDAALAAEREHEAEVDALQARINDLTSQVNALLNIGGS